MKIMVSACLLGENCKYSGGNNRNEKVLAFVKGHEVIPVCPEVMGGLPTPRVPAEIVSGVVMNREGVSAIAAFPAERAKAYPGAVAAVSVGAAEGKTLGFCNYLGETWDEERGTVQELYGKQLEGEIIVDIRAEGAADCESGCEAAAEVLLGGLPVGIRPGELRWESLQWEKTTGLFLRRGVLRCRAVFVAESTEDGEAFLDFILRGVMRN